ncbi:hypothetical protein ACLOJK_037967, partial [Asimina triloba]
MGLPLEGVSAPPMASASAGPAGSAVLKSYAQVVNNKTEHPTFKIPMRFLVDIDGEMGFVFSELEMTKAADEFRFGRYLGTDNAALNRTRASGAHICVEVDLTMKPVRSFPICFRQGHTSVVCRVGEKRKNEGKVKDNKIWQLKGIKESMEDKTRTVMGEKILETEAVYGNPNENMASVSAAHDLSDLNVTSPAEMDPEKNLGEVGITSQPVLINSADMIQHRQEKQVKEIECGQHVQSVIPRDPDNSDEECEEVWHGDEPQLQGSAQADRVQTTGLDEEENNDRLGKGSPQGKVTTDYFSEREEGEITVLLGKENLYDTDGERRSTAAKVKKSDAYEENSCSYVERRALWQELEGLQVIDQPWIVVGDFNTIRTDSERIGGNPRSLPSMNEFNEFID